MNCLNNHNLKVTIMKIVIKTDSILMTDNDDESLTKVLLIIDKDTK